MKLLILLLLISTPIFSQTYYPWLTLNIVDAGFTIDENGEAQYRFAGSFEFMSKGKVYSYTSLGGMFIQNVYLHLTTGVGFYIFDYRNKETGLGWSMVWNTLGIGIGFAYEDPRAFPTLALTSSLHIRYNFHKKTSLFLALATQGYTDFYKYIPYFGYSFGVAF